MFMTALYGLLGLLGLLVVWVIGIYNGLIKLRVRVNEAWSDIDVQLKRRHDLIPNLMETVKGYMTHEREVFEEVTRLRTAAMAAQEAGDPAKTAMAENLLSGALKTLFAVAENYPDLKANENFLKLQEDLRDTEDKIQAARRFYNGTVRDYNTKIQTVPSNIVAGMFGFTKRDFYELDDESERENVEVKF